MSDETIPQDLAKRMANWIRGATHITHPARFIDFKEIIRDLDALSAPKDPAQVAVNELIDTLIYRARELGDHFKQDAEREQASKALSDAVRKEFLKRGIATTIQDANHLIRRLYGWDRER